MSVVIDGLKDLLGDIEFYKNMFPETYTTIDSINETIQEEPFGICGIQVSPEWEDKCYAFEVQKVTPKNDIFCKYLGVWKC